MFVLGIDINIDPDIGTFGPLTLTWHGLFTAIAIAAAVWIVAWIAGRDGYSRDTIYNLALVAIPSGIIGARSLYVIEHFDFFRDNPGSIVSITEGGISVIGAIVGGAIGLWLFMVITKTPGKALVADATAIGVMAAQGIGRIGDLINGEHHAKVTDLPWGVRYIHPNTLGEFGLTVHPVAGGYEIIGALVIIGLLFGLRRLIKVRAGYIFWSYAILYSLMRIAFSPLRTNEQTVGNSDLSVPQLISFIIIGISVAAILYTMKFVKVSPLPAAPAAPSPAAAAPTTRRLRS